MCCEVDVGFALFFCELFFVCEFVYELVELSDVDGVEFCPYALWGFEASFSEVVWFVFEDVAPEVFVSADFSAAFLSVFPMLTYLAPAYGSCASAFTSFT